MKGWQTLLSPQAERGPREGFRLSLIANRRRGLWAALALMGAAAGSAGIAGAGIAGAEVEAGIAGAEVGVGAEVESASGPVAGAAAKEGRFVKLQGGLADLVDGGPRQAAEGSITSVVPAVAGSTVVIDATAVGNADDLLGALEHLGLRGGVAFGRMVGGRLPIASLGAASQLESLSFMRPAASTLNTGSVTSQGDPAMRTDLFRGATGFDGTGMTIGSLSDSYDCLGGAAGDVATGDLPAGVNVLDDSACAASDEGRAMMQLIHDVAPGASQAFHTAFGGQAGFAQGIIDLANAGADVINDDVIYFAEPMFQDGIIAQAVDRAVGAGIPYFSSAGNSGDSSYERPFNSAGATDCFGDAHDFDPGPGVDTRQQVTVPSGITFFAFQWDQPFASAGGAPSASDYDICLFAPGGALLTAGLASNVGGDPVEVVGVHNAGPPAPLEVSISRFAGPAAGKLKYVAFRSSVSIDEFDTASATSYGHANAAGAHATGAAFYQQTPPFGASPPVLEPFSSRGGVPILFDLAGNAVSPVARQTPDVVGPDGTNTTFFGGGDVEGDGFPNFFGTSAAAPHTAALATLILQQNPGLGPSEIYSLLESSAIDMGPAGFDFDSGHGLVTATFLIEALCAAPPPPGPGAIVLTDGSDSFTGTPGPDVIYALDGADQVDGGAGNDVIFAGSGGDRVTGGGGDDLICGGPGTDVLIGEGGNDRLSGDGGADLVLGYEGADELFGGEGTDRLQGGPGSDTIDGGPDVDLCTQGSTTDCP